MADELEEREQRIYLAQLAEQAERYDEMAEHMRVACMSGANLSEKERTYLAVAYKQAVGQRRASWRIVCSIEAQEESKGNHITTGSAAGYRKKIEKELKVLCQTILSLLVDLLIPAATTAEAKVSFYKAQGDYHRYIAEISDNRERTDETKLAEKAYIDGKTVAEDSLAVTNQYRLGLALNHAVFEYEVKKKPTEAVRIGRKAFEDAVREIDNLGEESVKDSALVMQLLRDNLTLWTADPSSSN